MKGLVLKDLYIIRDYWLLLAMSLVAVGVGMSIIVSPWVTTPIFATILGSVAVSTIQTDRVCNWHQLTATMPVRRNAFVSAKFMLYALALVTGLAIGMLTGGTVCLIQDAFDPDEAILYLCMSMCIALLPGSISIPCAIKLSPERSTALLMLSYIAASGLFAAVAAINRFLLSTPYDFKLVCAFMVALSTCAYGAAWWACARRCSNIPA